ncbi:MAG: sulfatase [Verrucomicrobiota bacterium]
MQRIALLLVATLALLSPSAPAAAPAERPNVVFFSFDDLNDWINPMGYRQALTPNLDRLAERGVTFQNAHTPATYCAPARSAIFTGRYATTTGCYRAQVYFRENPEWVPLQLSFQRAGYRTFGTGKLFHHREGFIDQRGWDEFHVRNESQKLEGWPLNSWTEDTPLPEPFPASRYNQIKFKDNYENIPGGLFLEYGPIPNEQEPAMADTQRIDWACSILAQEHDAPFFLGVGIYAPHFPNYAPQKYFDLYQVEEIVLPPYKEGDLDDLPEKMRKQKIGRTKAHHARLEAWGLLEEAVLGYLACVTYADAMLGRVLDAIENGPHADNTAIVIWSDHGYHHGEKGDWGKHTLWERTSNVPFIWAGPGIAQGQEVAASVSLIDMYPTFVDLCGLAQDEGLEGISLAGVLRNPATAQDRDVFLPYLSPNGFAVINQQWRYIHYEDGSEELYHVQRDPHEWTNLAELPEYAPIKKQLHASAPQKRVPPGIDAPQLRLVLDGTAYSWKTK